MTYPIYQMLKDYDCKKCKQFINKELLKEFNEQLQSFEELKNLYYVGAYDLFIFTNLYDHSLALYDESVYDGLRVSWQIPGIKVQDSPNKEITKNFQENTNLTEITHWPINLNRSEIMNAMETLEKDLNITREEETNINDTTNKFSIKEFEEKLESSEIYTKILNKKVSEITQINESINKEILANYAETGIITDLNNKDLFKELEERIQSNDLKNLQVIFIEDLKLIEPWKYPLQRKPNLCASINYPQKLSIINYNPSVRTITDLINIGVINTGIKIEASNDDIKVKSESGTQ